jgi:ribosomal protein L13E
MQKKKKPIVTGQSRGVKLIRIGRGYSLGEMKEAGLSSFTIARARHIPIDVLRKTIHKENVEHLKPTIKDLLDSRTKSDKHSIKTSTEERNEH